MRSWLVLVASLSVALGAQAIMSTLTPCSSQARLQLHLAAAVALAVVLVLAVLAFSESSLRRGEPAPGDSDEGRRKRRRRFLANVATAVAGLAALAIVAAWITVWLLSPCNP